MIDEEVTNQEVEVVPDQTIVEQNVVDESKMSSAELEAMSKGWTPDKEKFEADHPGRKWRDADAFLDMEEMIGAQMQLRRELRNTEKVTRELIEHNKRLAAAQRKKEIEAVRAQKLEAVEVGDKDAYTKLDLEEAKLFESPMDLPQMPVEQPALSQADQAAMEDFKQKNRSWCNMDSPENTRMVQAADQIYELVKAEFPNKTVREYLQLTEGKVKNLFSHRFQNTARQAPTAVSGATGTNVKKATKIKYEDLNSVQKTVCDALVEAGATRESYLEQLADLYGLNRR